MNLKEAIKKREIFLDNEGLIRTDLLERENLNAVVVIDELDEKEMKEIEKYCKQQKIKKLNCLIAENLGEEIFQEISPNVTSLLKRNTFFPLMKHAIFPDNMEFIILTDNDYYHIVVGSKTFIDQVLVNNIKETKDLYNNIIEGSKNMSKDGKKWLLELPQKYAEFYP